MNLWNRLPRKLRGPRNRMEDLERELETHLELEAEEQRESGLPA